MLVADRYRLGPPLGRGGMGEVYRAEDELLGRAVAIKFLLPTRHDDLAAARFRREARAAALLSDEHVVAALDFGEHDDGYFLVMELVEGRSVAEELRAQGPFAGEAAVDIVRQAAAGLAAAHRHDVVHRSDVYALGCVLYQLVTGHPPFQAEEPASIMYQHVETEPVPPSELRPDLAGPCETLLFRMLAKNPDDRPTAVEIASGAALVPLDALHTDETPTVPAAVLRSRRQLLAAVAAVAAGTAAVAFAVLTGPDFDRFPSTDLIRPTPSTTPLPSTTPPPTVRTSRPPSPVATTRRPDQPVVSSVAPPSHQVSKDKPAKEHSKKPKDKPEKKPPKP
jgi:serine/threonine protein kinase